MKNWFRERREKEAGNDPPRGKVNPVFQFHRSPLYFRNHHYCVARHPTFSNRFFLPTGLPSTIMFIQRLRTFPPLFLFFPESHEKSSCAGGSGELDKITWISLLRLSRILEEMNKSILSSSRWEEIWETSLVSLRWDQFNLRSEKNWNGWKLDFFYYHHYYYSSQIDAKPKIPSSRSTLLTL